MMYEERRAQRAAGIARGRLHKVILEGRLGHDPAVHHRVERHASSHAQILITSLFVQSAYKMERCLFQHPLRTGSDVPVTLSQLFIRTARWTERPADFFTKLVVLREV